LLISFSKQDKDIPAIPPFCFIRPARGLVKQRGEGIKPNRYLSLRSLHLDKLRFCSSDKGKPLVLERSVIKMDIWEIDIADTVVCDYCNDDYTESEMAGGIIIDGYAVCPQCEKPEMLKEATLVCRSGETFKQFVLRNRADNKIGVYSW
jgi:hypothetical protein